MNRTLRLGIATLSGAVGVLAGIAAAFGVFARGDGTFVTVTSARGEVYDMATTGVYAYNARQLVAEGIGWDVFTLAMAAPAMLIAAILVARGSNRATLVAAGLLGYFTYLYLEYAVTWALGPLFPLFIVLLAASLIGLVGAAAMLARAGSARRIGDGFPRRSWATLSIGMAALLTVMWVGRISDALTSSVPELHGETTMTVQVLDLGIILPAAVLLGVLALRRNSAGMLASAAFSVTFVAMSAAITAMMVSASIVNGVLQLPPLVLFGLATVAGTVVSVRTYRSLRPVGGSEAPIPAPAGTRTATLPASG